MATIGNGAARGLVVTTSDTFERHRDRLIGFAAARRLPAIYFNERFTNDGGLMSYGPNFDDIARRSSSHIDKILKGAHPGDLPVVQPTLFDLVINRKTARTLGLEIPKSVLLSAARVIE